MGYKTVLVDLQNFLKIHLVLMAILTNLKNILYELAKKKIKKKKMQ